MDGYIFPANFIWGTSTSAYQIEGGYASDGKGESIWDRFTHIAGKIRNDDNGDVACDHYHLYKEDVELLKQLGVKSYRFSISWPRVFPDGIGEPNKDGINFYKNLVKLLVENDIIPAITLYHWDLPQKLQDMGGWANREMSGYFEEYARYVFGELGDIVPIWMTFNEPWVSSFVSYWYGSHPPCIKDFSTALSASHNILLAHGKAVRAFREMGLKGEIGIALNLNPSYPASENQEDVAATQRYNDYLNRWFLDPILKGRYPEKLVKWLSDKIVLPEIQSSDMEIIHMPIDFVGVNNYSSSFIAHDPEKWPLEFAYRETGKPVTDAGWEIYPEGFYDLLLYLHKEYEGIKIIVTENGAAYDDIPDKEGKVEDKRRLNYLSNHITQMHNAIKAGVNLKGYYIWSFMDNFEWNSGYSMRFGLVHVDFNTLVRTIKESGLWYRKVIDHNGIAPDLHMCEV